MRAKIADTVSSLVGVLLKLVILPEIQVSTYLVWDPVWDRVSGRKAAVWCRVLDPASGRQVDQQAIRLLAKPAALRA
jgi:hypothetical protein